MTLGRMSHDVGKRVLRSLFEWGQHIGLDILPRHFYSEMPDIRRLRATASWRRPYSFDGIAGGDTEEQIQFVQSCCTDQIIEKLTHTDVHALAARLNQESGYGPIEAEMLFAFIASHRPSHIFQIGCGLSTAVCLLAADHAGYTPRITCVEPYPNEYLLALSEEGRIELLVTGAEDVGPSQIESLESDLLFFVDSSHTLGPAGEVTRIILEMLPRLKGGAWVHFHDIYFPYDYGRHVLDTALFFSHESALLQAFLTLNHRYRIVASLSMLHYVFPERMKMMLPGYEPALNDDGLNAGEGHFPSSTYLRVQ